MAGVKPSINKILVGIFIFILIINILVIFNLEYFHIKTVLSFVFLITVPGLLIMHVLRIRNIGFWEYLVYTVGLSIAFIIFTGYIINWALPVLKITDKPLSLYPLLISFDILLLIFLLISFIRNKGSRLELKSPKLNMVSKIFFIVPVIFPVLSILGAMSLNNMGSNLPSRSMLGGMVIYVICIVLLRKRLNKNIYPFTILMMGISLLLMGWLRGRYVSGADINLEYYIFQLVKTNQQWDISLFSNAYNTCLSVSLLPTILSNFIKINDQYIFKLVIPLIFSFMPVGVYLFLRRYTREIFAFLASVIAPKAI